MAYKRTEVTDGVTVMNQELYDNLQDGVDEAKSGLSAMTARVDALNMDVQKKVPVKTGTDEVERAYTYVQSNQISRPVSELPMKGALAVYDLESGNLQTGEPAGEDDCVRRIDLDKHVKGPCYVHWVADDRIELFVRSYDERYDLQVVFSPKGENELMSIEGFYKIRNTTGVLVTEAKPNMRTALVRGDADWISPHCVYAVNQVDGDFPDVDDCFYTGGHYLDGNNVSSGTVTARTAWIRVFADGYQMYEGNVGRYASCVKLIWMNLLQGSNTQKQDGSGRAIVSELVTVTCMGDGGLNVESEICALEDVQYREYRGMQMENGMEGALYFIGGTADRQGYVVGRDVQSADRFCRMVRLVGPEDTLEMEIDPSVGLGDGSLNDESFSARALENRISQTSLLHQESLCSLVAGDRLRWKGVYRLYPHHRPIHEVEYQLTNVDTITHQAEVGEGEPFATDFRLERGISLSEIEVTMDKIDVTQRVYDGGKIRIPAVNGDINIRAVSTRMYTNQIPISMDAEGHVYNGVGYKQNVKLDTNTGEETTSKRNVATTGFIPVSQGAVLRLDGMTAQGLNNMIAFYDSDKMYVCGMLFSLLLADDTLGGHCLTDEDGNVYYLDLTAFMSKYAAEGRPIAYIRGTFGEVNDRSVLTVNEEIVD